MSYNELDEQFINKGWQQMEALLDREMPAGVARPVWYRWWLFLLLIPLAVLLARDSVRHPPGAIRQPAETAVARKAPEKREAAGPAARPLPEPAGGGPDNPGAFLSSERSTTDIAARPPAGVEETPLTDQPLPEGRLPRGGEAGAVEKSSPEGQERVARTPVDLELLKHSTGPAPLPDGALPDTLPGLGLAHSRSPWRFGFALGGGLALSHPQPFIWGGPEAEFRLHPRWSLWSRVAYQWNRLGEPSSNDNAFSAVDESMDPVNPLELVNPVVIRQGPEDLGAHRVGLLLAAAYRPHPALRLELGAQLNYFMPYTHTETSIPRISFTPSFQRQYLVEELDFRRWETWVHTGLYWRIRPAIQLGAVWQQGLTEMSLSEGYSLKARQLSVSFRWQLRP